MILMCGSCPHILPTDSALKDKEKKDSKLKRETIDVGQNYLCPPQDSIEEDVEFSWSELTFLQSVTQEERDCMNQDILDLLTRRELDTGRRCSHDTPPSEGRRKRKGGSRQRGREGEKGGQRRERMVKWGSKEGKMLP